MATINDLTSFLKSAAEKNPRLDPAVRVQKWNDALDELYDRVSTWLEPARADGSVSKIQRSKIDLSEELVGRYAADSLSFLVGDKLVTLMPVGMFVIGAKGRVDMTGPHSEVRLVLVENSAGTEEWRVVGAVRPAYAGMRRRPVMSVPSNESSESDILGAGSLGVVLNVDSFISALKIILTRR